MKKIILIFSIIIISLSCSKDDENYININGKVIYQSTNNSIANAKLHVKTKILNSPESNWSYWSEIDSKEAITDSNGNFNITLKSENSSNVLVSIFVENTDNYNSSDTGYEVSKSNNIIIPLTKLEKLKIYINNTNPFNSNDTGGFYLSQWLGNVSLLNFQNFGNPNESYESQPGIYQNSTFWKGTNINSIVNYNVEENKPCTISWSYTKNGILTENISQIPIISNQINEFHINY
ncbi:hypothetical protein K5L04_07220 [Flavobacterium psychrophilum]|uniref:hypothetical protein n=1 Tax=Flavobacterium psychrophilum TaxID=96345 RepID=UPI00106D21EB|nr:hypothetical protein [Flavobacterium psychrophilum]MCB6099115.1 hypothetical protein [Flavobacterium psychrophilum]QZK99514.1 hypothetical protein K5L04_07220 [Flavobacterium psychrophilum]